MFRHYTSCQFSDVPKFELDYICLHVKRRTYVNVYPKEENGILYFSWSDNREGVDQFLAGYFACRFLLHD